MQPAAVEGSRGRAALLVALFAAALYAPTLTYTFTSYDDPEYVLHNPLIRSLDADSIRAMFRHAYAANYAPLHLLAYAVVHAFAGTAPWAYHALNVGLHALCAALAFLVLGRLGLPRTAALLGGAIFAAHPAQVEVVAWVNQTKTLLATAFGFGALLALLRARDALPGGGRLAYAGSLALFACALLSKPQAVAFPAIYFIADRAAPGARRLPWAAWMPFVLVALGGAALGLRAQAAFGAVKAYGPLGPLGGALSAVILLAQYLRLALFPADLSIVYEMRPLRSLLDPRLAASALLWGAIGVVAWRGRATPLRPWHALGFFAAPLIPVLGFVPLNVPMAERYLYPSLLGLGWFLGAAFARARGAVRTLLWGVPVLLALLTLARLPAWRDARAVWETAVREHPDRIHAWIGRGALRFDAGDAAGAEGDFRRALALDPKDFEAWTNLGLALNRQGKTDAALDAWRRALTAEPRAEWPRLFIARDLSRRGRHRDALALYDAVIAERPDFGRARVYRAAARERAGDGAGAERDLERAVASEPFLAEAHASLGRLREARGDVDGARRAYLGFLRVHGGDPAEAFAVRERLRALPPR